MMNINKVVKQLPCEEGLSRLRLFSLVRDYKRENRIEVSYHRRDHKGIMSARDGMKDEKNY